MYRGFAIWLESCSAYVAQELYLCFWLFVPFYRSLPLIMGVNADLNGHVFVGNKCWGIIGFNVKPIGPFITLLFAYKERYYLCHFWETPLMLTIIVHTNESNLSLLRSSHGRY